MLLPKKFVKALAAEVPVALQRVPLVVVIVKCVWFVLVVIFLICYAVSIAQEVGQILSYPSNLLRKTLLGLRARFSFCHSA